VFAVVGFAVEMDSHLRKDPNMEELNMAVYKQKSGFFRIQFALDGKNYIKSAKTKNRKAAELMESQWRTELHDQRYMGGKEEITVAQLIANWLERPLAENTKKGANYFFNDPELDIDFDVNASEFDQRQVLKFIERQKKLGRQEATIRTKILYLSAAWNHGNDQLYNIPKFHFPNLKKSPIKIDTLSYEDETKLFEYLKSREDLGHSLWELKYEISDVFKVLIDTGLRYNELCTLEWNKVDWKNGTIEILRQKNDVPSYIHMTERLKETLLRRFDEENRRHIRWVFPNQDCDGPRRPATSYVNQVLRKAGLTRVTAHVLRHSYASRLLKEGFTLIDIQHLMGHKSYTSSLRYVHLEKTASSQRAVEVMNARRNQG
jgi:integrase